MQVIRIHISGILNDSFTVPASCCKPLHASLRSCSGPRDLNVLNRII